MLPPSRPGPGLYWNLLPAAGPGLPRSAPAQPRYPDVRRNSLSEQQQMEIYMELPPETDVIAHINVGPKYQAQVPEFVGHSRAVGLDVHRADMLWHPRTLQKVNQRELDMYLEFACCASAPAGGRNKEYALHVLHMTGGCIKDAMFRLLQPTPHLPSDHPLLALATSDANRWTAREIQTFQQALAKYDKDFQRVSKEVLSKTTNECVQFYFFWKRVCVDDYARLRAMRRQREQQQQSRLRAGPTPEEAAAAVAHQAPPGPIGATQPYDTYGADVKTLSYPCEYSDGSPNPGFTSRGVLPAHARLQSRVKTRSPTPDKRSASAASPASSQGDATEEFPCKLCGKVFYKVKSRNAHMKSHRPPDAESKRKSSQQRHSPSPHPQRPPPGRAKLSAGHHMSELPCLEPSMLTLPNQGYVIPNM
ncbi:transcriptional-regulating factor 1-like [Pollicipes pollicipes]|uniref:transcriptional-regulating factor 1-like n=1 Tax=Pollicipes pollicipes TaxID=41117 RepID=UPI00188553BA|nr:transcriptional-regulating factor 1-like [Pollicipes pollicipes]